MIFVWMMIMLLIVPGLVIFQVILTLLDILCDISNEGIKKI